VLNKLAAVDLQRMRLDSPESARKYIALRDETYPPASDGSHKYPPQFAQKLHAKDEEANSILCPTAANSIKFVLANGPATAAEIYEQYSHLSPNTINQALSTMTTMKLIFRVARGVYALTPDEAPAPRVKIKKPVDLIEAFFDANTDAPAQMTDIVQWGKNRNYFAGYDKVDYELRKLESLGVLVSDADENGRKVWRRV
jgi:hypothetical protein